MGYSRAVRVGPHVWVSGTTDTGPDGIVRHPGDVYSQTVGALSKIEAALTEAGASLSDVVRTRLFVTDMAEWEAVGRAHGKFFRDVLPCATMVEVRALIDPEVLVEVEAEAFIGSVER